MFAGSVANQNGFQPDTLPPNIDGSTERADQRQPCAVAAGAQRHGAADRKHADLAQGFPQPEHGRIVDRSTNCGRTTQTLVPTINFGVVTGDPAQSLFTGAIGAAAFPGASDTNLHSGSEPLRAPHRARQRHQRRCALDEGTNEYSYMGVGTQRARMRETGFFVQDSWRWKPNFTINLGLRYELQYPVLSAEQQLLDDDAGRSVRRVRRRRWNEPRHDVQPLPAGEHAWKESAVHQLREGHATPTTRTTTTLRRAWASRGRSTTSPACWAPCSATRPSCAADTPGRSTGTA